MNVRLITPGDATLWHSGRYLTRGVAEWNICSCTTFSNYNFQKKNSISYFMWYENKDIDLYFKLEWFWLRCVLCVKLSFWTLAIVKIVKVAMFRNFILLPSSGWEMENQSVLSHDWAVLSIYLFIWIFVCLFVILASLAIRTEAYECKFVFVSSSQKHSFFFSLCFARPIFRSASVHICTALVSLHLLVLVWIKPTLNVTLHFSPAYKLLS